VEEVKYGAKIHLTNIQHIWGVCKGWYNPGKIEDHDMVNTVWRLWVLMLYGLTPLTPQIPFPPLQGGEGPGGEVYDITSIYTYKL